MSRKIETSAFLSAIFIFWRSDFAAGCEDAVEHSQPNSKSVYYYNNRLTVLNSILTSSCKIWVTKNGTGAQKNTRSIFKSNAPTLLKLDVGLDHMYTKGCIFFRSGCAISSWNKMTCNSFIAKDDLIQHPLCLKFLTTNLKLFQDSWRKN